MIDPRFYHVRGPFSLGEILEVCAIDLPYDGLPDEEIVGLAPLAEAKTGELSFLVGRANKKYLETSQATACFVNEKLASFVSEKGIIPLVTYYPRACFGKVMSNFGTPKLWDVSGAAPQISTTARVHPTTHISSGAIIGDDVVIGPHGFIGPGVSIAQGSHIDANVSIQMAEIGHNCRIKSGAVIGSEGFGADTDGQKVVSLPHLGRVIIGDDVFIGSQTCIDRGFLGDTIIEDQVKIDNLAQIAHNVFIGTGSILAGRVGISGSCHIGKNVRMGGAVGLADHLTIGDGAQIAASSGLMKDVPAGEVWGGTPAMPLREQMKIFAAQRKLLKKS